MNGRASAVTMGGSLAVSAGIHAFVIDAHMQEWWLSGAFFAAAVVLQTLCAYMVLRSGDRRAARTGAISSLVLLAIWTTSRTVGIPIGPGAGTPEQVGGIDVLASAAELVAIAAFLIDVTRDSRPIRVSPHVSNIAAITIFAVTFSVGTVTAAALPRHSHSHGASPSSPAEDRHAETHLPRPSAARDGDEPHHHDIPHAHQHP